MANAISGAPLPGGTTPGSEKVSSGPPPPPRRRSSEHPATPTATQSATATPPPSSRAEYVPAPPRAPVELPKIPRLELPEAAPLRSAPPPPVVAASAPPARSSSVPPPPPEPRAAPTTPPARYAPTQPGGRAGRAGRAFSTLTRVGETLRARLPVAVKERIEGVPAVGLLVGGSALAVLVLATAGLTARAAYRAVTGGADSQAEAAPLAASAAAPAAGEETTADEPAKPAESPAAQTAPADEATVLLDLGAQLLTQRKDADVPSLVARLIAREPSRKDDPRVGKLLLAAAASDDRRAAADAHALLTGPMGEAGAALVYELSLMSGVRDSVKARAQTWLAGKDFERVASLPVFAAQKLRSAKTCEDKHALLDFAGRAGGKHVLSYLKEVEKRKACAPDDLEHCYPCMRNDSKLSDVIASLEKQ